MQQLKQLGLTQLEQALPTLYETARQEQWTYETFFSRAIAAEIEGRDRRAAERRMSAASSKLQPPSSSETSSTKLQLVFLEVLSFGAWSFTGVWSLDLGASTAL